jgi:hypothetical protein
MLKILKSIIAFLKSPLGRKVTKTAGELAKEGLERAQKKGK